MFDKIRNYIKTEFTRGHRRTVQAKLNIVGIFFLKGVSILLGLLIVPLTINYISPYQYGIWIALSSIIGWLSFFDIGFGNGLRHKFVEATTQGKRKLAKIYVSTTYAILTIIIVSVWAISSMLSAFVDWSSFLNVSKSLNSELSNVVLIVLSTFALQFILGLLSTILSALQKPAVSALYGAISQVLILIGIFVLTQSTKGSLLNLSILIGSVNSLVLIVFSAWFFTHDLKDFAPSFKFVKFRYAKDLMNLGLQFFLLQIVALVYYETNNIIITKVLTPVDVTIYNIAFKYMSVIGMFFSIIITPFWSAFAEAKVLDDYSWMKKMAAKLRYAFFITAIVAIVSVLMSPFIYKFWLGKAVSIPLILTILMGFWQISNIWNSLHSTLIYGLGKIRLQLFGSITAGIINLPLTIYFCHMWKLNGIVLAQILLSLSVSWIGAFQLNKLLNKTAYGIWDR
jgi:O-antigen/teichoic acid export membrane protein